MKVLYTDLPEAPVATPRKLAGRVVLALLVLASVLAGVTAGLVFVDSTDLPQVDELQHYRPVSITDFYYVRQPDSVRTWSMGLRICGRVLFWQTRKGPDASGSRIAGRFGEGANLVLPH